MATDPFEVVTGYRRTEELVRADLRPDSIIEAVCIDIYDSLIDALIRAGYDGGSGCSICTRTIGAEISRRWPMNAALG